MPKIVTTLKELENVTIDSVILVPMEEILDDLEKFQVMVEQLLDPEAIDKGEYIVKASYDEGLEDLKETMDKLDEKMKKQLNNVADDLGLQAGSGVKLEHVSQHGYHFRITLKEEGKIRKNKKYTVLDSVKGGVRFVTEKLSDLNEDYAKVREEYEEKQKTIVEEIVRISRGYMSPWTILNNQIAQLDCFVSLAMAAATAPTPYVRPQMYPSNTGRLELMEIRHPCLELQDGVNYIANDVAFKQGETNMYIITGKVDQIQLKYLKA
jgi:DNA mismatch repair protein MSH2